MSNYTCGLPKWPAVFITGASVTPEQAKEIIFRTDDSLNGYMSGNDRHFKMHCHKLFGWQDADMNDEYVHGQEYDAERAARRWARWDAWRQEMKLIPHHYVYNSYLSSAYIGGPTGWMGLDGTIFWQGHNYGKWPSVEEVVEDWKALVEAFPFLDLQCTLHSGESCEEGSVPVVTIIVKDGQVTSHQASDYSLHCAQPTGIDSSDDKFALMLAGLQSNSYSYERAWPAAWMVEFAERSRPAIDRILQREAAVKAEK